MKRLIEYDLERIDNKTLLELYKQIIELQKKYNNVSFGKKQIAMQIVRALNIFMEKTKLLPQEKIQSIIDNYEYNYNFVNDAYMFLRIILRLANEKENKYILKTFYGYDGPKENYIEGKNLKASIFVVGNKEILDMLDDKKIYYKNEFSTLVNQILKKGYSLIIMTKNGYCITNDYMDKLKGLRAFDIPVDGDTSNIDCYLYDDELLSSVNKFKDFIMKNGADIEDIDENSLFHEVSKGIVKK